MLGPEPAPTSVSRSEFITCPIGYSRATIQSCTIRSAFSFVKSSMPAITSFSAAIRAGFSPFQNLATPFSSYSSGALNKNHDRFHSSCGNVARSLISATAFSARSFPASIPFSFSTGISIPASSASLFACRYCALNQRAFSGLNRAPLLLTRSSENAPISSSIEKISCSVPGFQPSSASMLTNASGK